MNYTYQLYLCITLFLLLTGRAFSQQSNHCQNTASPIGINLSLWKKIATQPNDIIGQTVFNLGMVSTMNQLNGIGLNILGSKVKRNANGLQVSGITQIVNEQSNGISLAGLVNIKGLDMNGISFAGITNITGLTTNGITIGGLINFTGKRAAGLQLAGIGNITGESSSGISIGGLINVTGNDMHGVQLSGIMNISTQSRGAQLAPVNVTVKGKGVQIGLVNYYQEQFDGIQLGLVNANKNTHIQLMAYGGSRAKINLAVRFKNELFYTILGTGSPYLDFDDKFSGSLFYRAGMEIPLYKKLFFSGDMGYQHIETFKNKRQNHPARFYALQARLNLEWRANTQIGYFISGGYSHERIYQKSSPYQHKPIIEAGVVIYKL